MNTPAKISAALKSQRSLEDPIILHTHCTKAQTKHNALQGFYMQSWCTPLRSFQLNLQIACIAYCMHIQHEFVINGRVAAEESEREMGMSL